MYSPFSRKTNRQHWEQDTELRKTKQATLGTRHRMTKNKNTTQKTEKRRNTDSTKRPG
jgi:hypothetical protein